VDRGGSSGAWIRMADFYCKDSFLILSLTVSFLSGIVLYAYDVSPMLLFSSSSCLVLSYSGGSSSQQNSRSLTTKHVELDYCRIKEGKKRINVGESFSHVNFEVARSGDEVGRRCTREVLDFSHFISDWRFYEACACACVLFSFSA
jgi:hypothetical protein